VVFRRAHVAKRRRDAGPWENVTVGHGRRDGGLACTRRAIARVPGRQRQNNFVKACLTVPNVKV
jgi:hypothetical protein